jgi:hypothetical protein
MKRKLKKYELKINVKDGAIVNSVALVEEPAIESNFLAFKREYDVSEFAANDEKMELLGAAMIPEQLIFRRDKKTGEEFEVYFTADTIREIAQQYFKSGFQNSMNINHTSVPAKSYIFQSYIVDTDKGLNPPKGIDVPNGSWVIGVKVDDKDTWNAIKAGKVKGFSIEGMFEFIEAGFAKEENLDEEVLTLLHQLNNIISRYKK